MLLVYLSWGRKSQCQPYLLQIPLVEALMTLPMAISTPLWKLQAGPGNDSSRKASGRLNGCNSPASPLKMSLRYAGVYGAGVGEPRPRAQGVTRGVCYT